MRDECWYMHVLVWDVFGRMAMSMAMVVVQATGVVKFVGFMGMWVSMFMVFIGDGGLWQFAEFLVKAKAVEHNGEGGAFHE